MHIIAVRLSLFVLVLCRFQTIAYICLSVCLSIYLSIYLSTYARARVCVCVCAEFSFFLQAWWCLEI